MKNTKIEAIVFDLAGTLIDFGSQAPSKVLIHIFNENGIPITRKEAIGPMGIEKKAHISQLIYSKKINLLWKKKYKKKPSKEYIVLQMEKRCLTEMQKFLFLQLI